MIGFKDYLEDCMQNPAFKEAWEHIQTGMPISSSRIVRPAMQIFFYEKNGFCPTKDLLESIRDQQEKATAICRLYNQMLHDYNSIKPFCSQYVRDGISGLKIETSGSNLVLFFFPFGNLVILVNGYIDKEADKDALLQIAIKIENEQLVSINNTRSEFDLN